MRDGAKAVSRSNSSAGDQPTHTVPGSKPAPGLYLVATPIGNLDDITLRALKILQGADVVACEDTRVTGKLLSLLGISAQLTPYHEHNAERARPALMARIREGGVVALVSDAGTPLVSDPGYRLVRACIEDGLMVTSAPGASAVLTALQLSGLPSDRFLFAGFLPTKQGARRAALAELSKVPATLVFYESPRRLDDCLPDMAAVLGGGRDAAVGRELTKMFEEVRRGTLDELAAHYSTTDAPKGEAVIVVGPPGAEAATSEADLDSQLRQAMTEHSLRDAAALVCAATGLPKREVYARAVLLTKADG
ncbi:MAG TPA: 16S rRNA (cytidine(1402)-2'-O)-methyltransferase [Patescibacteria group bacterium]|nr:16S rRNA (cytidine(1402)-2'-O)-methyltransferase [Patescibacteria group bacterium]